MQMPITSVITLALLFPFFGGSELLGSGGGSSSAPSGGDTPPSADMQKMLDRHNYHRCMHGVPLMTWSNSIASNAQEWANEMNGRMDHSPSNRRNISPWGALGENLMLGSIQGKDNWAQQWVDIWYNEIEKTNNGLVSGFSSGTGHYTQVVWKSSTALGCGYFNKLLVCQYGPAGNYGGQYSSQVQGPVDGAECPWSP